MERVEGEVAILPTCLVVAVFRLALGRAVVGVVMQVVEAALAVQQTPTVQMIRRHVIQESVSSPNVRSKTIARMTSLAMRMAIARPRQILRQRIVALLRQVPLRLRAVVCAPIVLSVQRSAAAMVSGFVPVMVSRDVAVLPVRRVAQLAAAAQTEDRKAASHLQIPLPVLLVRLATAARHNSQEDNVPSDFSDAL